MCKAKDNTKNDMFLEGNELDNECVSVTIPPADQCGAQEDTFR